MVNLYYDFSRRSHHNGYSVAGCSSPLRRPLPVQPTAIYDRDGGRIATVCALLSSPGESLCGHAE